jgi:serine/threonine-protein kinase
MGEVWLATHNSLGGEFAIKLVEPTDDIEAETAAGRFQLEAQIAAKLSRKTRHIVSVSDHGEENGLAYLVMELLEGESLDQRITRLGPVPVDASLRIMGQVARALGRAHTLGIVHRDLKPENIFLTVSQDDDGEIAKVLDFGIAKIKAADGSTSATRTGAVLGTPLFMSPEQARALRTVDHRTDIYSFGIVTYTMMTGQPAFTGESFGDILVAICTQPLPSMRAVAPWLPPTIDDWLARACAREPGERFSTVEQTLEGLYLALGVASSTFASPEIPRAGSSGLDRRGVSPSAPAAPPAQIPTLAASAAGISTGAGDRGTTSGLMVSGADIPKRSMLPAVLAIIALVALLAGGAIFVLRRPSNERAAAGPDAPSAAPSETARPPEETTATSATAEPAPAATHIEPKPSAAPPSRPAPVQHVAPARPPEPRPAPKPPAPPPTDTRNNGKAKPKADLGF